METQKKIDSSSYSRFFRCLCKDLTGWQNIVHCFALYWWLDHSFCLVINHWHWIQIVLLCN